MHKHYHSVGLTQARPNKIFFKFHRNSMQRFRVDLKTFMGLAMPAMLSELKYLADFLWDFWARNPNPI